MKKVFHLMFFFFPLAFIAKWCHWGELPIFVFSGLALVPVAWKMGEATEHLSSRTNPAIGALLNATFGNATELIIAEISLYKGMKEMVLASITGSILSNILLLMGLSFMAAGMKRKELKFGKQSNNIGTTLLFLTSISLIMPTIFHAVVKVPDEKYHQISMAVSTVLFVLYLGNILFTLFTHKELFNVDADPLPDNHEAWSIRKSVIVLCVATLGVCFLSDIMVEAAEPVAHMIGFSNLFMGGVVFSLLGNAAEHSTAIIMAMKNKMDLSIQIAIGSSIQISMLVTPILVFSGYFIGKPLDLVFTAIEVVAIFLATIMVHMVIHDGKSNWLEGKMLVGAYAIFAILFYYTP